MDENHSQVRALYMEDDRIQHQAAITKIGSSEINKKFYNWIQLSETIFHPKGGGQPSDEGTIEGIKIAYVHKDISDRNRLDKFEIYHCFETDQPFDFKVGNEVGLIVDGAIRSLNARLHTAGHVLAEALNLCFPEIEAYQGNHYPNNSYVKFKIHAPIQTENKDEIIRKVVAKFSSWIDQDLKVTDKLESSGIRSVQVFQSWSPCGGTHVKSLKEIGQMQISDLSINRKEGTITVKYAL